MKWKKATKRYRLVIIAIVVFCINVPLAWILFFTGHYMAAIIVISIGNLIIYRIVWRLL